MRKTVQIRFHSLKHVGIKENVKSSEQPQINVLPTSLSFINQERSQIFFLELRLKNKALRKGGKYNIRYFPLIFLWPLLILLRDSLQN